MLNTRRPAWLKGAVVALFVLLVAGAFAGGPRPTGPAAPSNVPDTVLYQHIVQRMQGGAGYYAAAAREHRAHVFPLRPFLTVRLPTLSWINAALDPRLALRGLLLLTALAWASAPRLVTGERALVAILVVAGGWQALGAVGPWIHEVWAALLLALSVAVYRRERWWFAVIAALAAVLVRELALPFLLLAGCLALVEGRRREALGWAGAIVVFGLAMAAHRYQVIGIERAGDNASPGWFGMLGYRETVLRLVGVTPLAVLPAWLGKVLAVAAWFGWLGLRDRRGVFVFAFLAGMILFLAIVPRVNNVFWPLLVAPLWIAGLAFLPRLILWLGRGWHGPAATAT